MYCNIFPNQKFLKWHLHLFINSMFKVVVPFALPESARKFSIICSALCLHCVDETLPFPRPKLIITATSREFKPPTKVPR